MRRVTDFGKTTTLKPSRIIHHGTQKPGELIAACWRIANGVSLDANALRQ
jgi:hypothetical protein